MQSQQAKLQKTELQIASGLRIMKPSDDPSSAAKILNLSSNIDVIDQFTRNVGAAESSLVFEESVVASVNTNLQRIRELTVQGNNATNSAGAKESIAQEIYQRLDELISLANARDASGEYIFGGFKVDSPPFVDIAGSVSFQGDQGQRLVQIGKGSQVAVGDSGEAVFQKIPSGDGNIQVLADVGNTGSGVIGKFGLTGSFIPDRYTVSFSRLSGSDQISYSVTDGNSVEIATGPYVENSSISFAGAQFVLTGEPENGDKIVLGPSQNLDLFSTVRAIADALARPASNAGDRARFHNELGSGLANLDQGLNNVTGVRAGIGARLNNIETLNEINLDFKLQLETVLSGTRDLDYAEAIGRFNLQLTSLQAAQQAFVKTSGLTLFQYI
jgi:flagellar hook-associated protein 3 FlgL